MVKKKLVRQSPYPDQAKSKRKWFPKLLSRAEWKRRHAIHVERQRKMGISEEDIDRHPFTPLGAVGHSLGRLKKKRE